MAPFYDSKCNMKYSCLTLYYSVLEEEAEEESGMEFLVRKDGSSDGGEPDQELTSAAATAESLQPTGFTLETAHVRQNCILCKLIPGIQIKT